MNAPNLSKQSATQAQIIIYVHMKPDVDSAVVFLCMTPSQCFMSEVLNIC